MQVTSFCENAPGFGYSLGYAENEDLNINGMRGAQNQSGVVSRRIPWDIRVLKAFAEGEYYNVTLHVYREDGTAARAYYLGSRGERELTPGQAACLYETYAARPLDSEAKQALLGELVAINAVDSHIAYSFLGKSLEEQQIADVMDEFGAAPGNKAYLPEWIEYYSRKCAQAGAAWDGALRAAEYDMREERKLRVALAGYQKLVKILVTIESAKNGDMQTA